MLRVEYRNLELNIPLSQRKRPGETCAGYHMPDRVTDRKHSRNQDSWTEREILGKLDIY